MKTTMHVIRDCILVRMVWQKLIPRSLCHLFFSPPWQIGSPPVLDGKEKILKRFLGLLSLGWIVDCFGCGVIRRFLF